MRAPTPLTVNYPGGLIFDQITLTDEIVSADTPTATISSLLPIFGSPDQNVFSPGVVLYTIGTPGVPEPASWLMMIGGLGLVGGALRSRRKTSVRFS